MTSFIKANLHRAFLIRMSVCVKRLQNLKLKSNKLLNRAYYTSPEQRWKHKTYVTVMQMESYAFPLLKHLFKRIVIRR